VSLSLRSVRSDFLNDYLDVDGVVSRYRDWLEWIVYVICFRFNFSKGDYEYAFFRGLKRGDRRYNALICRKFERLARFGRKLVYFGYGSHGYVKGSGLHVVLEYDANVVDLRDAWLDVGSDFNRFMSRVRRLFGKVSVVRVFESHESAYPHIHVVLVFHDYVFLGYSSRRRGHMVYRVFGVDYKSLKACWIHGFSDVEMVGSFGGGVRYLSKYLAKSTSAEFAGVKGIRGLAMCWVFRKRSFSVSGSLFLKSEASEASRASHDEIKDMSISNSDDSDFSGFGVDSLRCIKVGTDLYGNSIFHRVERWRLFGFCVRNSVLWDDWCLHFVDRLRLVCVSENKFNLHRSRYDLVVEAVRVVDDLCRSLNDFL